MSSETFSIPRNSVRRLNPYIQNPLAKLFIFESFTPQNVAQGKKSMVPCLNPLDLAYWSTQPYQFGSPDKAVKYFLKPAEDNNTVVASTKDYDYLRLIWLKH